MLLIVTLVTCPEEMYFQCIVYFSSVLETYICDRDWLSTQAGAISEIQIFCSKLWCVVAMYLGTHIDFYFYVPILNNQERNMLGMTVCLLIGLRQGTLFIFGMYVP